MNYTELFIKNDHPDHWEHPPAFDPAAADARFARFVAELAAALGFEPSSETGSQIQDASFHSQIYLPTRDGHTLLRFSNFGDMAAIFDEALVPEPTLATLKGLLIRHGYVYVPEAVHAARYAGCCSFMSTTSSWWDRFFEWE